MLAGATNNDVPEKHHALRNPMETIEAWTSQHWPAFSAAGYALAFAVVFGGVALAAYHSGFTATEAAVCAALAIFFIRVLRAIHTQGAAADRPPFIRPSRIQPAKPDEITGLGGGGVRADRARPRPRHHRAGAHPTLMRTMELFTRLGRSAAICWIWF